jgi:hypothetical protein
VGQEWENRDRRIVGQEWDMTCTAETIVGYRTGTGVGHDSSTAETIVGHCT